MTIVFEEVECAFTMHILYACVMYKRVDWILRGAVGVLGVDHDLISGAILCTGFGFNGGGWLWRPVGVHTELLGQMHVPGLGSLAWAAQPGQTLVRPQVNAPLKMP